MQAAPLLHDHETGHGSSEVIGGISFAQWQAFTIEDTFSKSVISPSSRHQSQTKPSGETIFNSLGGADNKTNNSDATLDIEKVLDKELLRIFLKYESRQREKEGIVEIETMSNEHLNFCTKLIGKSLKNENWSRKVSEDHALRNERSKKGENNGKSSQKSDPLKEEPYSFDKIVTTTNKGVKNTAATEEDNIIFKKVIEEAPGPARELPEGENWPLLKNIMRLETPKVLRPVSVQMGHGFNRKVRKRRSE